MGFCRITQPRSSVQAGGTCVPGGGTCVPGTYCRWHLPIVVPLECFDSWELLDHPASSIAITSDAATVPEKLQSQLDLLGEQGWELTAVIARRSESSSDTLIFKRRKTSSDVDIDMIPEMNLERIRGDKVDVEKTVQVIEEIKKKAILKK